MIVFMDNSSDMVFTDINIMLISVDIDKQLIFPH